MKDSQWLIVTVLVILLAALSILAEGCATVNGIGRDLQDGSDAAREYFAAE